MANDLFRRQLASYASVHRDWRNKVTHFAGIPLIVFSLLLILSLSRFEGGGRDWTLSLAVAIVAVLSWMALDLGIGIIMGLVIAPAWYGAVILAGVLGTPSAVWTAFTVLFWLAVYLPGAGWAHYDPTNRLSAGYDLIPVAIARHPGQAVPLEGSWFGDAQDYLGMSVKVTVHKLGDIPDAP